MRHVLVSKGIPKCRYRMLGVGLAEPAGANRVNNTGNVFDPSRGYPAVVTYHRYTDPQIGIDWLTKSVGRGGGAPDDNSGWKSRSCQVRAGLLGRVTRIGTDSANGE
jgi:hypothetical protein